MYIKDTGKFRPRMTPPVPQQDNQMPLPLNQGGYQQPIIYIINNDNCGHGRRGRGAWGGYAPYRGYRGGIFDGIFRLVYTVRSIITFILVSMVVVVVIMVLVNPSLINTFFQNIMRRLGLYDTLINFRRMLGR